MRQSSFSIHLFSIYFPHWSNPSHICTQMNRWIIWPNPLLCISSSNRQKRSLFWLCLLISEGRKLGNICGILLWERAWRRGRSLVSTECFLLISWAEPLAISHLFPPHLSFLQLGFYFLHLIRGTVLLEFLRTSFRIWWLKEWLPKRQRSWWSRLFQGWVCHW